ncbi:hypothetical protein I4U23_019195 [Adineta vaga]|nr:hypothetical protein I4U23_019195 [Adineta vaga]
MNNYEFYYEQYRREPRNPVVTQKDLIDYHSAVSTSTCHNWSQPVKRSIAITYIDGSTLINFHENACKGKGLFPKGKYQRKPLIINEKKHNTTNVSKSSAREKRTILDTITISPEKTLSMLSMTSPLPDLQQTNSPNRISSALVLDEENSAAKLYGCRATTHGNGGWIRRYKSINQSQIITNFLRDLEHQEKVLLRKRTCQQSTTFLSSSTSSMGSLLNKRRRNKS